jgi:putative ABC transport system permease protein
MNFFQCLLTSFLQLLSHPLRTILTLIGIVIGVASLLAMIGIGEGTRQRVISDMERLGGTGLIIIEVSKHRRADKQTFNTDASFLKQNDFHALLNSSTPPEYARIRGWDIAKGRFILDSDISDHRQACILGSEVKSNIFGELDPIGKRIRIGSEDYSVVGVMEERKFEAGRWMNHLALVPISTLNKRVLKKGRYSKILVKAKSTAMVPTVRRQLIRVLETRHGKDQAFKIFSQEEVIRSVNQSTMLLRLSLGVSATIVLLAGGIGIMNLMLVSVTERTREIGVRKAVGATDMAIMSQFLQEAIIISATGGFVGIVVGILMAEFSSQFIAIVMHDNIQSIISLKAIFLTVIFIFFVGVFFGLYPAFRAAKLDPSKALSYE